MVQGFGLETALPDDFHTSSSMTTWHLLKHEGVDIYPNGEAPRFSFPRLCLSWPISHHVSDKQALFSGAKHPAMK